MRVLFFVIQALFTLTVAGFLGYFYPFLVGATALGLAWLALAQASGEKAWIRLALPFAGTWKITAMFAPAYPLALAIIDTFGWGPGPIDFALKSPRHYAAFAAFVTLCCVTWAAHTLFVEGVWRLVQYRQFANLPLAKVRSVALGLARLRGTAIAPEGEPGPLVMFSQSNEGAATKLTPFYLDDGTGRILVDPQSALIRPGWTSNLDRRISEVVLRKRVKRPSLAQPEVRELHAGDRVEVVGHVSADAAGDLRISRLVEPDGDQGFDIQHVFFLTDSPLPQAEVLWGAGRVLLLGVIYFGSMAWLAVDQVPRWRQETWTTEEIRRHSPEGAKWPHIEERLRDPDPRVRAAALDAYIDRDVPRDTTVPLSDEANERFLRVLLADPDEHVVDDALYAYFTGSGDFRPVPERFRPQLHRLLRSENSYARRLAVESLQDLGVQESELPLLAPLLGDSEPKVVGQVLATFKQSATAATWAIPVMRRTVTLSTDREMIWNAINFLNESAPDPAFALVTYVPWMDSPDPGRRSQAYCGLSPAAALLTAHTERLIEVVREYRGETCATGLLQGQGHAARAASPVLREIIANRMSRSRDSALEALAAVEPDWRVTYAAAVSALSDPEDKLRLIGARLLGVVGKHNAGEAIGLLVKHDGTERWSALENTIESSVVALLAVAPRNDPSLREVLQAYRQDYRRESETRSAIDAYLGK